MKRILFILVICFLSNNILAQDQQIKNKKEFIQVAFLSDGKTLVDGKEIPQEALIKKLNALKEKKGEIHYYNAPKIKKIHLMKNIDLMKTLRSSKLRMISYKDKDFKKRAGKE